MNKLVNSRGVNINYLIVTLCLMVFIGCAILFARNAEGILPFGGYGGKAFLAIGCLALGSSFLLYGAKQGYDVVKSALVVVFIPLLYLWANGAHGFSSYDGVFYTQTLRFIGEWLEPFKLSGTLPLQGFGDAVLPMNVWLNPVYMATAFLPVAYGPFVSTLLAFAVTLGAAAASGRMLKQPAPMTGAAALAYVTLVFPPACEVSSFYCQIKLNPSSALTAWLVFASFAALVQLMRDGGAMRHGAVLAVLTELTFLVDPLWFTVAMLTSAPFFIAALVIYWPLQRKAIVVATSVVLVLIVTGLPQYIYGIGGSVARTWFGAEIFGIYKIYDSAFLPFRSTLGLALFCAAFAMFVIGAVRGDRYIRILSVAALAHAILMVAISAVFLYTDINWVYPAPMYLEFGALPFYFYILYAVGFQFSSKAYEAVLAAAAPVVFFAAMAWYAAPAVLAGQTIPFFGQTRRPPATDITAYLAQETALHPGAPFRGLTATFVGVDRGQDGQTPYSADEALRYSAEQVAPSFGGNDLRWNGLWEFSIPTLESYSQLVSPPVHMIFSRLLGRETDEYGRNMTVVGEMRTNILRLSGVRFVIVAEGYDTAGLNVVQSQEGAQGGKISIIELENWNRTGFSPTRVTALDSAPAMIGRMKDEGFDPATEVLVEPGAVEGKALVAAESSEPLVIDRRGTHVSVKSPGWSLLVLPLQYSNCLTFEGSSGVRLVRADVAYTAVLFNGAADGIIRNTFGVGSSACKLRDIRDFKRLKIGPDGAVKIPEWTHPHAIWGMNK